MQDVNENTGIHDKRGRRLPRRKTSEIVRLGGEIYLRDIRHKVEPDHVGEYAAIDVESGCWALGKSTIEARTRLDTMRPEATDVFIERIGYMAVGSIGGGTPKRTNWSAVK